MIETHDWAKIEQTFPYVAAMRLCIQDPIHHGEGDVWTHTKLVMAALNDETHSLRLTTLFHDVAKPETRVVEFDAEKGREVVRHPNHSRQGAAAAWFDMWMAGEDLQTCLEVYWLCRWHQKVFHIWDEPNMERAALSFALLGSWDKLIQFAQADNAGRICADIQKGCDNLDLMHDWLAEQPRPINADYWDSEVDRMFYLEKGGRSPQYRAQKPTGSHVYVLSGLPGVGKDSYCRTVLEGLPVVSLDSIRDELDIDATDNQGRVVQAAFEQARVFLRAKKSFVWNAQTVTRLSRDKIIGLCRAYDAYVEVHAFNRPLHVIEQQNRQRECQVPIGVILAAARKWEPPCLLEAHVVKWV